MPTVLSPLITDAGLAAAVAQAGNGLQLAITHVALGTGQYTPTNGQTNMTARKEKATIAGGGVVGAGAFRVNVLFPSWSGSPNPYTANEIGFWAGDPDAGGVLFAVYSHPTAPIVTRNALDYVASFGLQLSRVPTGSVTVTVDPSGAVAAALLGNHLAAADPHSQYVLKSDLESTQPDFGLVRKPTIINPVAATTLTGLTPLLQGNNYYSLYGVAMGGAQFQVSTGATFSSSIYDSGILGAVTSRQVPSGTLTASTSYYARCRYRDLEGVWSSWSDPVQFSTGSQTVATPSITAPANGNTAIGDGTTLVSNAFSMASGSDTHGVTDWEIWTGPGGTGDLVFSSYENAINKTSIAIPAGTFGNSTQYYPRCRYAGVSTGYSAWSTASYSFTTLASFTAVSVGSALGGGYFAGYTKVGAQKYALIVSPRSVGERSNIKASTLATNLASSRSVNDGKANTDAMIAAGAANYPAAQFCKNLSIDGYRDWYMPSRDEMELIYRNLKPGTDNNNTDIRYDGVATGVNNNSVPVGSAYVGGSGGSPTQTSVSAFQVGGAQALDNTLVRYGTSTYAPSGANIVFHQFQGVSNTSGKQSLIGAKEGNGGDGGSDTYCVRAVRRVAVT